MGILSMFKKVSFNKAVQRWNELNGYQAVFSAFGKDVYKSDLVRACVRPLASFTSKASAVSKYADVANLLNNRPNLYMNGRAFLKKVRTMYETKGSVCILIERGPNGRPIGYYPVPYSSFEALDYNGKLFLKFYFTGTANPVVVAWEDLAVLRKDYNNSDIIGDDNFGLLQTLNDLATVQQGFTNAIKSTANLRGILKSTKAMLNPKDIENMRNSFVKDYMTLENQGGIAALDATLDFSPIKMEPFTGSAEQAKELRMDVYRSFGVNDDFVTGKLDSDQIEAVYEFSIEPFLADLSDELTSKSFTEREISFGAFIIYEASKLQFASLSKKIQMYKEVVLYGGMSRNEWRKACNMSPIEGGDDMIMRLDAAKEEQTDGE